MEKRPELQCNAVIAHVAEKLAKEVKDWSQEKEPAETYVSHLEEILKHTHTFDGYELAQELESCHGYSPDAQLVDVLDNAGMYAHRKHSEIVKLWVKQNNIQPKYKVGEEVYFETSGFLDRTQRCGEISAIREETAEYTIFCAELGHVREGMGTHGIIQTFEALENYNERKRSASERQQPPGPTAPAAEQETQAIPHV